MSVQTLCHNPQNALENIVLSNTSSTECVMASIPSENSMLFLCSCIREHDCNDRLIFEKGANGNNNNNNNKCCVYFPHEFANLHTKKKNN